VKIDPAATDGSTIGSTTDRKVRPARAPRSAEASSRLAGSSSSAVWIGRIMYGSQRYVSVSTAAVSPNPGPLSPNGFSIQSASPPSERISRHAYTLTR
jgi:hypothetical protein